MPGYLPPEYTPQPIDPLTGEPLLPAEPTSGAEGVPVNSLLWGHPGAVEQVTEFAQDATELAQNAAAYDAARQGRDMSNLPNVANELIPKVWQPTPDPRAPAEVDGQQFPAVEGGNTEDYTFAPDVVTSGEKLPDQSEVSQQTTDVTDRVPESDGDVAVKYGEGQGQEAYKILTDMGVDHDKAQAIASDVASAQAIVGHNKQVVEINAAADAEQAKNLELFTRERAALDESYRLGVEKRMKENEQRQMALEERIQKNRESPSGAWDNMSGFSKLMTTLSLISGAVAEAISKDGSTKNPALPIIMRQIELDMQATRNNRAADIQLLQELRVGNRENLDAMQEAQQLKLAGFTRRAASVLGEIERKRAGARTKLEQDFYGRTKTDILSSIKDAYGRQSEAEEAAHAKALALRKAELENAHIESRIQTENARAQGYAGVRAASTGGSSGRPGGGSIPQQPAGSTDYDPTSLPELWAWDNDPEVRDRRQKDKSFNLSKFNKEYVHAGNYTDEAGKLRPLFVKAGEDGADRERIRADFTLYRETPHFMTKLDGFISRMESAGPAALDAKFGKTDAEKELQEYASWIQGKLITLSGKQNLLGNLTEGEVKTQTALFTGQTEVLKNLSGKEVVRAMKTTRRILKDIHEETLRMNPRFGRLNIKLPALGTTKQARATDTETLAAAQSQYEAAKAARGKATPGSDEYKKLDTEVRAAESRLKTTSQTANILPRTETGEQLRKLPTTSDPEFKGSTTRDTTLQGGLEKYLDDVGRNFDAYVKEYSKNPSVMVSPEKKRTEVAEKFAVGMLDQVKKRHLADVLSGGWKIMWSKNPLDAGYLAELQSALVAGNDDAARTALNNWVVARLGKR